MNDLQQILMELCWIAHEAENEAQKSELMYLCERLYNELQRAEQSAMMVQPEQFIISNN